MSDELAMSYCPSGADFEGFALESTANVAFDAIPAPAPALTPRIEEEVEVGDRSEDLTGLEIDLLFLRNMIFELWVSSMSEVDNLSVPSPP